MTDDTAFADRQCRVGRDAKVRATLLASLGLASLVNLALLVLLNGFVWLNEDPLFWRNAGGWAVGWRDTVLWGFSNQLLSGLRRAVIA